MKVDIYIEGQRLDLYDDENISVTSNLQDINDISKLYADFSQSFTVPASRNNNTIFKQYYNPDLNEEYDARTRKQASIDVNTLDFKRGKMRLDEVKMKNGEPESYKITFFGNAIKLKDDIGEDKLEDLSWLDNFDHAYSDTQVKTGMTSGLDFTVDSVTYTDAIVYPLISYKRQWKYNSNSSDVVSTDTLVNIAYDSGRTDGIDFANLKPAIKADLIKKAIEEEYNVTFTGSFFTSQNWLQLYMNLNRTTESLANGFLQYENVTGSTPGGFPVYTYQTTVTPDVGYTTVDYKIRLRVNDTVIYESTTWLQGNQTKSGRITITASSYTCQAEIITKANFNFSASTIFDKDLGSTVFTNSYSSQSITLTADISKIVPDIKVYDFLDNLFKMFNLVITTSGDEIYVNDLQTWYGEGQIYDITKFVNTESETVKRGKIYREINWRFKESDQILSNEFRLSNNQGYGDLEFKLTDSLGNALTDIDGDVLDIDVEFENPIHERLLDENDSSETTIQYTPYFDRNINQIAGDVFLFYAYSSVLTSNSIGFKNSTGYEEITDSVFMPSHSLEITDFSFTLNFNAEINEYTSQLFQETIFYTYYEDYITDLFNIKRRLYSYKAILPDNLLSVLKLNDRLIIKDRRYLINRITSNLIDREDTIELINDIYDAPLASDTLNTSLFRTTSGIYGGQEQTNNVDYIGVVEAAIGLVDTGDGTSWINLPSTKATTSVYSVEFELDQNLSGDRQAQIQVTDGLNNPTFTIYQKTIIGALGMASSESVALINNIINIRS